MVQENLERDARSVEERTPQLHGIQIGSKSAGGSLRNERGALDNENIVGFTKNDAQNGAVGETLSDRTKLLRKVLEEIGAAEAEDGEPMTQFVFDLSRAQSRVNDGVSEQNLTDAEIADIVWVNKVLFEQYGISLILTSLNPETERRLRAEGVTTRGLQLRTKDATTRLFRDAQQRRGEESETSLKQAA
jgi:hypothetical protein